MSLTPLAVTSITNILLACETFFLSGLLFARAKTAGSAAWCWQFALLLMALSAMIGGIDHGFFEMHGEIPMRKLITQGNWLLIGLMAFFVLLTTARQFLEPRWQVPLLALAATQFVVYCVIIIRVDDYRAVVANYIPAIVLMLILNLAAIGNGKGSRALTIGIVIDILASGVQATGFDEFNPLDRNGLYHLGMMAAVGFFYAGGLQLQGIQDKAR